jgi:hypothetical protein
MGDNDVEVNKGDLIILRPSDDSPFWMAQISSITYSNRERTEVESYKVRFYVPDDEANPWESKWRKMSVGRGATSVITQAEMMVCDFTLWRDKLRVGTVNLIKSAIELDKREIEQDAEDQGADASTEDTDQ